jgi:hypothetical protein
MFVLMLHGFPISAKLLDDPCFGERFWYWEGHSGRAYIHSIYEKDSCPPLSEAVIVLVRVTGNARTALCVGRLGIAKHGTMAPDSVPEWNNADEIHVHLLARDPALARAVEQDLVCAWKSRQGFGESGRGVSGENQLALAFA